MSSNADVLRLPDLVRDNKLETSFDSRFTVHRYDDSDEDGRRRSNQRFEYWEDVEWLARGGFGEVSLQRCVKGKLADEFRAVKKINRHAMQSQRIDYVSELEAIAKFSHRRYSRCFVKLLGWYDSHDCIYIAMEYCPLGDLQQYMEKTGPMAEADVRSVVCQVLEGLHQLHDQGFAHRDIKPGNVLIKSQPPQGDWWVKLSDFGLSKRIKAPTEMVSKVLGTLQYMAPELLSHEPGCSTQVDHRAADMWSLGEMVHRMLTATAVFPSQLALIRYTLRPDSLPSHELTRHGASSNAISFIHALMKPTPEHRLTADKGLEHAWIQPCQSFRANSSLSRSGTPSPASTSNTPSFKFPSSKDYRYDSWAFQPSIGVVLPSGQDSVPWGTTLSTAAGQPDGVRPARSRSGPSLPAVRQSFIAFTNWLSSTAASPPVVQRTAMSPLMKAMTVPDSGSSSTTVSPPVAGEIIKWIMANPCPGLSSHGDRDGTVLPGLDRGSVPADVPRDSYSSTAAGSHEASDASLACSTCGMVFKEPDHLLNHMKILGHTWLSPHFSPPEPIILEPILPERNALALECGACHEVFQTPSQLYRHITSGACDPGEEAEGWNDIEFYDLEEGTRNL